MLEKLKQNQFIYNSVRSVYDTIRFMMAYPGLSKISKKKAKYPIRICIISQMPNLWTNVDELYQRLCADDRFEVFVLMVPEFDYSKEAFDIETMNTDSIYSFHAQRNHKNCIPSYHSGKWEDLRKYNFDYILYERPYSHYLPAPYRISSTYQYAKTCYSPYGFEMMNYVYDTSLNVDFFRYLYLFFSDNHVSFEFHTNRTKHSHKKQVRKTVLTGHPTFVNMLNAKGKKCTYWKDEDSRLKVIWAPRWTFDVHLGGSNFLTYKDKMVQYILKNPNTSLVFRPHPLTFKNFISKGMLTQEEADQYLALYEKEEQLNYDKESDYFATFWASDVFVGDISSIIPNYFLTGKPIIYCHTGSVDDNDVMKKIFEVSYHANSFEDTQRILDDLQKGMDPLKEERLKMVQSLFGIEHTVKVVENIINALIENA